MIRKIYQQMWREFCSAIINDQLLPDSNIDNPDDDRRGITALAYLNKNDTKIAKEIFQFQDQIRHFEPEQYFYPTSELHLTILSIISCMHGFTLSDITPEKYSEFFKKAFTNQESIKITFKGITASPSCIVVQGFPSGKGLESLRDKLRNSFAQSGLHCSYDTRYKLVTAHSTVIRFRRPLKNSQKLLEICEKYREHEFGTVTLTQFELVFNDWYQRLSNSIPLSKVNRPQITLSNGS